MNTTESIVIDNRITPYTVALALVLSEYHDVDYISAEHMAATEVLDYLRTWGWGAQEDICGLAGEVLEAIPEDFWYEADRLADEIQTEAELFGDSRVRELLSEYQKVIEG